MLNAPQFGQAMPDEMLLRFAMNAADIVNSIPRPTSAKILYHYTSGIGFERIIDSGTLWATHVSFMNDAEEYIDATRVLNQMADSEIKKTTPGSLIYTLLSAVIDNLKNVNVSTMYPWFITCFSMCRNDLSQWRCYSGREAKFALGFELPHLYRIANALNMMKDERGFLYRCHLSPVIYHAGRKELLARSVLNFMTSQIEKDYATLKPDEVETFVQDWIVQYFTYVSVIAPMTKNKAFRREREWRLLIRPIYPDLLKFRNRGAMLTPYLDVNLRLGTSEPDANGRVFDHPLREVWIGPSPYTAENHQSAYALLVKKEYWWANLHRSDIPYRDF